MTTRIKDWQGPRNLTGGDGYLVDLGMVSVRDAAIYGRSRPLIPYADGRVISSVRFIPPATPSADWTMWLITPNTTNFNGFGVMETTLSSITDTYKAGIAMDGTDDDKSKILDCGPLIAGINVTREFEPLGTWAADTKYCLGDAILDPNGNMQLVTTNGVSDSVDEPTWGTNPTDETTDGSITWQCQNPLPSADDKIHAVVEVIEGVSPMPPYPAILEFIQQPTDAVAEATISPAITVKISDQNGDPYVFTDANIKLNIFGAGTLVGTASHVQNKTTGIATFDDLSITEPGTGYILRAELYPTIVTDAIFSDPFDVTAP